MKLLIKSLLILSLVVININGQELDKPSAKVQSLLIKYNLKTVDYDYVKDKISKGTRNSAKAVLIDARPEAKYKKGTIPSSINIPDTMFTEKKIALKAIEKNKELIVFCGGFKCTKSAKLASLLQKEGYKNVKVYAAGQPQWNKRSYKEIDAIVLKKVVEENSAFIIDARPYNKYLKETIVGSISIPDTKVKELNGKFPIDKKQKIITFCGGLKCAKSHNIANELISLGYGDVSVYAQGLPNWKKLNYATTASSKKVEIKKEKEAKYSKNGLLLGVDEGTVDGEWFKKLILENKVPAYIQIVDVTSLDEYKEGHLKGAINIEAEKLSAKQLISKLPKNKTIVFNCTAGGRSVEAWSKLNDINHDMSEIFYFDANIDCKGNDCKIEVNEPLE